MIEGMSAIRTKRTPVSEAGCVPILPRRPVVKSASLFEGENYSDANSSRF
jgi:hypothetical protein